MSVEQETNAAENLFLSSSKDSNRKSEEEEKLVVKERQEARERYQDLITMVSARYESLPEKVRADFIVHNQEILDNVVEVGIKKEMKPEELKALEISAILHDLNKADAPPEKLKDVPNYTLIAHGELAAEESKKILTDEKLKAYGFEGDLEAVRAMVSEAIREHMGPHPGFMTAMLEKANAILRAKGEKEITAKANLNE